MNLVVAHYLDGRIIKGTSLDVHPSRPACHVRTTAGTTEQIALNELKALFFVRSLEGDATHHEERTPDPHDPRSRGSTLMSLRFADGEEIVGLTIRYPPISAYFFVVPVDASSNNIRILINRAAVVSMNAGSQEQTTG